MLENRGLEIIIIAVVVLLLFGAKRLPDSARALGKSLRILKSEVGAMKGEPEAAAVTTSDTERPVPRQTPDQARALPAPSQAT